VFPQKFNDAYDDYIVVAFINATLVLSIGDTVEEVTDSSRATVQKAVPPPECHAQFRWMSRPIPPRFRRTASRNPRSQSGAKLLAYQYRFSTVG